LENKRRGILDSLFASVIGFDGVSTQQFRDKRKRPSLKETALHKI
jgi:hypothetical protein